MDSAVLLPILVEVYAECGMATDQLPYTEEFEFMYAEFCRRTATLMTRSQFWRFLANERKRGRLPRVRQ